MAQWTCQQCGVSFKRDKAGDRAIKFCSQECYHASRAGKPNRAAKGSIPWNKGTRGVMSPNATSFKKGNKPANWSSVGTVRTRTRARDGCVRAWVKTAEPNVWRLRARVEWEKTHGLLPQAKVVHHRNGDALDDRLDNLQAVSKAEHAGLHQHEIEQARRAGLALYYKRERERKGVPDIIPCDWCGTTCYKTPAQYLRSPTHFCSRSCWSRYQNHQRALRKEA